MMPSPLRYAMINLRRSHFTTSLNLLGLTTAFAAFILIMLYVWNEYHFDCFNQHVESIYRLEVKSPDNPKTSVFLLGPTGQTLVDELPEIEISTTYMPWGKWGEETFTWDNGTDENMSSEDYAYADLFLTDVFTFQILKGKHTQPLFEPQTAIISESFARKAWGETDPVGKQLKTSQGIYTISAVFADFPENSVITCPVILRMPTIGWIAEAAKGWNITNYPQFIKVKRGTDNKALNHLINTQSIVRSKYNFYQNGTVSAELIARPLRDLHFTTAVAETPMFTGNNRMFVNSLFWVGILILIVALINYINFATANAPRRIKSLSISRIIGSNRGHLIFNFILETVLLFALSFLIAICISWIMNHYFTKGILGYRLPFEENFLLLLLMGAVSLMLGGLTALYPAFYCTAGKPVESIKRFQVSTMVNFRGVLTVSQFAATIALIAVSILVVKQVRFMEKTNLGFQRDNTLVIRLNNDLATNYTTFKAKMAAIPGVNGMARSRAVPGQAQEINTFNVNGQTCPIWYWAVDDQYIDMMGITIVEGRTFIKDSPSEERNMICNETAARKFGWTIGTKIGEGVLVGIMKDFNFVSLREEVEPFAFWYSNSNNFFGCVSIKLNGDQVSEILASIGKVYSEISPSTPLRYYFLDDHLNLLYAKENQQVKLITTFSLLSILVSVLGILGLSTFMCQYRIKEIGIRKVNGAKVSEMLTMLNRDFIKWVALAFFIGTPVAWIVMQQWLNGFAYKTHLSWWIFALSGLTALLIAVFTVSWQSWKSAARNPVEALRYE